MKVEYEYELWNGKKVLDIIKSDKVFLGKYVFFPDLKKRKRIKVPLITRIVYEDGVNFHFRFCLDVRRKSKKQIQIICGKEL